METEDRKREERVGEREERRGREEEREGASVDKFQFSLNMKAHYM